jgi:hypothetical protein
MPLSLGLFVALSTGFFILVMAASSIN